MNGQCAPLLLVGMASCLQNRFGYLNGVQVRSSLIRCACFFFLSLQLNLYLPQMNYRSADLLPFRHRIQTVGCFFSTERNSTVISLRSGELHIASLLSLSLPLSLLVSRITQLVLQLLLPGLSLLILQEIVCHGGNIAPLQHMPKAANFHRHFSPSHPHRFKGPFVQSPQASSAKLPRNQC
jgi:hypothetical protein